MDPRAVEFVPGAEEHNQRRAEPFNPQARPFVPRDPRVAPETQETAHVERPERTFERRLAWIVDCSDGFDYTSAVPTGMSLTQEPKLFWENGLQYWTKSKNWVHHINFFGEAVYTKSATNPATTIAVLKASSKWIVKHDPFKSRNHFVVTKASRLLDPVKYYGKPEVLNSLSGTALENACMGQCVKFYAEVGTWLEDDYDEDEHEPCIDSLDPDKYWGGQTIINGCSPGFPTRVDILSAGTEERLAIDKARQAAVKSRIARGPAKSRLSKCYISFDNEDGLPGAVVSRNVYSQRGSSGPVSLAQTAAPAEVALSDQPSPSQNTIMGG
ncbi:hypothetical protein PV08_08045 [Exophiala spinifera]|uniref:Uncharacterized protein n=1 Tax=Exophiala spinifera TaxID=91928 RepID=A0A0D2B1P5_9EURO|nr:uncharacterized protein PV08_08045 [Exophiala spinifera]KIW12858.1 hypothetical protein PV08_08045 [Exophiala spinifera]